MASSKETASSSLSTRDRLRQVALELFAERGYSGTSMAVMAERVGVRKATLYNYYRSKEDLLMDLLEESIEAWKAASRPPLEDGGRLGRRLLAHLRAALEFTAAEPYKVAIIRVAATQIGGELGARVRSILEEQRREYFGRLRLYVERAMAAGEIAPGDPEPLALMWKTFVDGVLANLIFGLRERELYRANARDMWAICWRGLSSGGAAEGED